MIVDENDLLLAFLHDPPDKALDIKGHVSRASWPRQPWVSPGL